MFIWRSVSVSLVIANKQYDKINTRGSHRGKIIMVGRWRKWSGTEMDLWLAKG